MNPTEKLYILLEFGNKYDCSNEIQTLIDKGAILDKEYTPKYNSGRELSKPLFIAIQNYSYPNIVRTLKNNYYDGENMDSIIYYGRDYKRYTLRDYLNYQAHMIKYFAHEDFTRLNDARTYIPEYFDIFGLKYEENETLKDYFIKLKSTIGIDSEDEETGEEYNEKYNEKCN